MNSYEKEKLNKQLGVMFRKFKITDIKEFVIPILIDDRVSWAKLQKDAVRFNTGLNKTGVSKLLLHYVKDKRYEDLDRIYNEMLLKDISLNNKRRLWYSVVMSSPGNSELLHDDWKESIIDSFRHQSSHADVYTCLTGDLRWFVIVVKNRTRKTTVMQRPILLCVSIKKPYLFFSPKNTKPEVLESKIWSAGSYWASPAHSWTNNTVINGIGYQRHKLYNLDGRDIRTLIRMLNNKNRRSLIPATNSTDFVDVVRSSDTYNYTHGNDRAAFAAKCVGPGGKELLLQEYVINVQSQWRSGYEIPNLNDFPMKFTIKSKNITKSITNLGEMGAIKYPFPDWLKKFAVSGKNEITIKRT